MDRFDTRLKAICEEFNHIEETAKEKVEIKGGLSTLAKRCSIQTKAKKRNKRYFQGSSMADIFRQALQLIYSWEFLMKRYLPGLYYG